MFKQKTEYEMGISDWSSDVCSSDLWDSAGHRWRGVGGAVRGRHFQQRRRDGAGVDERRHPARGGADAGLACDLDGPPWPRAVVANATGRWRGECGQPTADSAAGCGRSEEHTSELQSLMRISYAVFCLKKKNYISNVCTSSTNCMLMSAFI